MHDPWFQAFLILPPRICGIDLLPFSVAHDYILSAFGNPYIIGGETTEADLFKAIAICGRTWEQNRTFLLGRERKWLQRSARWAWKWHHKMDFATADASLKTYLADYRFVATHSARPQVNHGREIAASSHWHLVGCLMQNRGMTESEAWNCAYNRAQCHFDCWGESQGDETLDSVVEMTTHPLCAAAEALFKVGDTEGMKAKYAEVEAILKGKA